IGGDFTVVQGMTRNYIARLNADGTLDSVFNPDANGSVHSIVLQADGKILVGGVFSGANSIGGQLRNFIARLDNVNGAADTFDPNADAEVDAIAVQANGHVLAGGSFTTLTPNGGATINRHHIARLDPTGAAD